MGLRYGWSRWSFAVASAVGAVVLMVAPAPAMAASHASKPTHGGGGSSGGGSTGGSSGGGGTATPAGSDISWPQCGGPYPSGQTFAIVGVNGGLANNTNPCVGDELSWAGLSAGGTTQPKAAVYVNTADPGNRVADWPKSGGNSTYGNCDGSNSTACAWQYGYNMAQADLGRFANPTSYPWWLDVETGNSWQPNSGNGLAMNIADLRGMEAALQPKGITAGIYSTSYQWGQITGGDTTDFAGVPDWIPGASTESDAQSNCSLPAFTGGSSKVTVTQWFGTYDNDWACP